MVFSLRFLKLFNVHLEKIKTPIKQKKSQLLLEAKAEPSEWEKDKQELETEIERYRNSYNDAVNSASQNYAYAQSVEKQLLTVGIVAVVLFGAILVLSWIYFFR